MVIKTKSKYLHFRNWVSLVVPLVRPQVHERSIMCSSTVQTRCLRFLMLMFMYLRMAYSMSHDDKHGGVPMGIPNTFCDDGKKNISIDWDVNSDVEYTCPDVMREPSPFHDDDFHCTETADRPIHVCYPTPISYDEDIPTSGRHRPLWPVYGEYTYLPPQRWLHSLEHGAVVFLYHPCANEGEVEKFKEIARDCLRRHIISPYLKLPIGMNFALVTWKCKHVFSNVNYPEMVNFIKNHALRAPERNVFANGQYDAKLKHEATIVSDKEDSQLCPKYHSFQDFQDFQDSLHELSQESDQRSRILQNSRNELRNSLERLRNDLT